MKGFKLYTLDLLCKAFNWQGGTIHNAIAHFSTMDKHAQDNVFSLFIMPNLSEIKDLEHVKTLSKIRTSHLVYRKV